ncbi:hypothetical protein [Actinocatenispora comari]|uniref:Uncharacterized protein n=1 Tax=Actinocatenispora comari TaxID=2807577 RepID=A0A8J4A6C4_9ACTN|nr:hypothetical protein [Actinocatenispora comari]GIL25784.1 hypothetical protein NUM_10380 [Actinocatenispora comari]
MRGEAVRPAGGAVRGPAPAQLLRSGAVRSAATIHHRIGRVLPVYPPLRQLLPDGGLRRGSVLSVAAAIGGTSLMFALLGAASQQGEWCAMVGLPNVGVVSAAEFGVAPERLALVPDPGHHWWPVVGALLDGFGLVVARPAGTVPVGQARRLAARARQRGAVLVVHGDWPGADVSLRCTDPVWEGLSDGRGRLRRRTLTVRATGRGAAARPRSARLLLPAGRLGEASVVAAFAATTDYGSPAGTGAAIGAGAAARDYGSPAGTGASIGAGAAATDYALAGAGSAGAAGVAGAESGAVTGIEATGGAGSGGRVAGGAGMGQPTDAGTQSAGPAGAEAVG